MHGAAWSRMELHEAAWSHRVNFKYYRSRMETLSVMSRDAWSRMEPPCKLQIKSKDAWSRMEPHGAAWSRMELHGAAWNHRINYKSYRSRMETLSISSRDTWNRMEPLGAACSHRVNFKYYRSRMETLSISSRILGTAWSRLEQHAATVSTLNTTGAVWRPFQLVLEMHGAA